MNEKRKIYDLYGGSKRLWGFEDGYKMNKHISFILRDRILGKDDKGNKKIMHKYYGDNNWGIQFDTDGYFAEVAKIQPRNAIYNYICFCFTHDIKRYFNDGHIATSAYFPTYKKFSSTEISDMPKLISIK